jgi:hypothetical protein
MPQSEADAARWFGLALGLLLTTVLALNALLF